MGSDLSVGGYSAIIEDSNLDEIYPVSDEVETAYVFIKATVFPISLHKFLDNAGYKEIKERPKDEEGFVVHTNGESQWIPKERYEKLAQHRETGNWSGDSKYHLYKY